MATKKAVNTLLQQARQGRKWTQRHLAEILDVEPQTVRSWERGTRSPSSEIRSRLCEVFGLQPEQLGLQTASSSETREEVQAREDKHAADLLSLNIVHVVPSPPSDGTLVMDKNRLSMLKRVEMRWMDVLEHALYKQFLILLTLREQPEAVEDPWRAVMQESARPDSNLPAGSHISEIYDGADGELLILGEPGAGKTTLLLELTRTLLERTRHNVQHPLPVVFNLSEWTEKHQSLQGWLVEELRTKYQVPPRVSQRWIEAEQILPLLDGLDEVAPDIRTDCIQTINTYREAYGLLPLVVCCRSADYFSQPARLLLNRAIAVQPLTMHEIDAYIRQGGPELVALRQALQQDPELQEVASTPLMLNTLIFTYQGLPNDEILVVGSPQVRRSFIIAKYVERMLGRRSPKKVYTAEQIKLYLKNTAQQLQKRNQTEFYVERMQPDWIEGSRKQQHYQRTVIRLITIIQCVLCGGLAAWLKGGLKNGIVGSGNGILGLFGGGAGNSMLGWMSPGIGGGNQGGASLIIALGIVIWLVTVIVGSPSLPTITPQSIGHGLLSGLRAGLKVGVFTCGLTIPFFSLIGGFQHGLSYGFGIGFFLAMSMGMMRGLLTGLRNEQRSKEKASFPDQFIDGLLFGVGGGLSFMVVELLLQVNRQSTLIYSSIAALFFLLAYGFGGGVRLFPSLGQTIKPAEIVTWSWERVSQEMGNNSKKSVIVAFVTLLSVSGVIGGVSSLFFFNVGYGFHYGLVFGTICGLIIGSASILTSMLKSGWSSDVLPEDQHTKPNEGISRSGRNALIGAIFIAPIGGVASGIASGIGFGLVGGLSTWLVMAMAFALMLAIVFFTIFVIAHGGIAWVEHYVLRWYLWREEQIPWNYVHFLNTAATYGLLRRVGGGYMFTHQLILEYFAQLHE